MAATITSAKHNSDEQPLISIGPGGPWHESAPRRVQSAYQSLTPGRGWGAWQQHLLKRKVRKTPVVSSRPISALLWALPEGADMAATVRLVERIEASLATKARQRIGETEAQRWLSAWAAPSELSNGDAAHSDSEHQSVSDREVAPALESLAWCLALPQLAQQWTEDAWWELANGLASIAAQGGGGSSDPLAAQLLHGELPLALACTMPELEVCQTLADRGRRTVSEGLTQLLDERGRLHAHHWAALFPLLASWTRTRAWEFGLSGRDWSDDLQQRFTGLVHQALRLARPSGGRMLGPQEASAPTERLLPAAVELTGDDSLQRALRIQATSTRRPDKPRTKDLPPAGDECEWSGGAQLRTDWHPAAARLAVNYSGPTVQIELISDRRCLLSGSWEAEVAYNGERLAAVEPWEQLCWESDDDVDYLELSLQLAQEISIERHILLARREGILVLADTVLGIQEGRLDYRASLPLANQTQFVAADETREGTLNVRRRPVARVLPLSFDEWRAAPASGALKAGEKGLELTQSWEGQSLIAPLLIDLDQRRLRREVTWRRLTVGQKREIVGPDVAAGFRAQVGSDQWLVFRSLLPAAIRTVLGQNINSEFLVARFKDTGEIKALLEIE